MGALEQWNLEREGCLRQHEGSIDIAKKSGKTQKATPRQVRKAKALKVKSRLRPGARGRKTPLINRPHPSLLSESDTLSNTNRGVDRDSTYNTVL